MKWNIFKRIKEATNISKIDIEKQPSQQILENITAPKKQIKKSTVKKIPTKIVKEQPIINNITNYDDSQVKILLNDIIKEISKICIDDEFIKIINDNMSSIKNDIDNRFDELIKYFDKKEYTTIINNSYVSESNSNSSNNVIDNTSKCEKEVFVENKKVNKKDIVVKKVTNKITDCVVRTKDEDIDLVYVLKEEEVNPELVYSLRSVENFCTFRKIWIVGHKPEWVKNVEYIPTVQDKDKWANIINNWIAACKHPDVSQKFVMMNDDFIATEKIQDWHKNTNKIRGMLNRFVGDKTVWQKGFNNTIQLLSQFGYTGPLFHFDLHMPLLMDKTLMLEILTSDIIQNFINDNKGVIHYRSLCRNLGDNLDLPPPDMIEDVKLEVSCKVLEKVLENHIGWISLTNDNIEKTPRWAPLLKWLDNNLPNPSKFEEGNQAGKKRKDKIKPSIVVDNNKKFNVDKKVSNFNVNKFVF